MSQWIERVKSHAVWATLETLGNTIDQALKREDIQATSVDDLERLRAVLAICGKRLASTDPILVTPTPLTNLNARASEINALVGTFASNGDVAQLSSANAKADDLLVILASVPSAATSDDLTGISEAASSYRTTLEKHLTDALVIQQKLEVANKTNEQQLDAIRAALIAEQQKLTALTTDQNSQFSAAQDKRASDFTAAQGEQLSKFTTAFTEYQTQFSTDQDTRKTAFSEAQRENQEEFSELMVTFEEQLKKHDAEYLGKEEQAADTHRTDLAILQKEYVETATDMLEKINQNKIEVESLVGVIGNLGVTSGYQKVANQARKLLYLWQFLTVLALGGLVAVAFFMAFPKLLDNTPRVDATMQLAMENNITKLPGETNDPAGKADERQRFEANSTSKVVATQTTESEFYRGLAARIFLSLTFGIFAAYAGRQASHFFSIEQKNRRLALELEALGPFIEPLEKEERDKFRIQIGERSFAVPETHPGKHKEGDPVTAFGFFRSGEIQDFIKNEIKEALKTAK